jgi:hypothetical protein
MLRAVLFKESMITYRHAGMGCGWVPGSTDFVRVVQFRVCSKVQVRRLLRILTTLKNAIRELLNVRRTVCPSLKNWVQNWSKKAGKSLRWSSNVLIFCIHIN